MKMKSEIYFSVCKCYTLEGHIKVYCVPFKNIPQRENFSNF